MRRGKTEREERGYFEECYKRSMKKTKEKTIRSQSIFSSLSSILLRFFSAFSLSSVCEQDQTSRRLIKSSNETERSKKKRRNRERGR